MKRQGTGSRVQEAGGGGDPQGLAAAARVVAAGGRVPKRFAKAVGSNARPVSAGPTLEAATALQKITPARRVAFEILQVMAAGQGHSDELLHSSRTESLSEQDRGLATALVMGVLRWQIALDARVRKLLERPGQKVAEPVMIALRMGAFQLLHMDRIPAHAALSESVELCRAAGEPHAAGMVNAILRRVAGSPEPGTKVFETAAAFAIRLGHPVWLVERWAREYGREAAREICEADQLEPGGDDTLVKEAGPPDGLPGIDRGSRLVAEIAAAALPSTPGRVARVWDCCAAPGGKTLVLAAKLAGAEVLATDVSARRLAQMEVRVRRYSYAETLRLAVYDASALPPEEGEFDLILCDAPCSGTGTLRRNPEIRLRLVAEELTRQAERQRMLLGAALKRLAPGGRLVYSTCSLEREENEAVVEAVAGGWSRVAVEELGVAGVSATMVRDGALRTLPGVHGCDGFYAAILER